MPKCLGLKMYNILIPSKVDKRKSKMAKGNKEKQVRIFLRMKIQKMAKTPFGRKNCGY